MNIRSIFSQFFLCVSALCFVSNALFSQDTPTIDSLKALYVQERDTAKAKLCFQIASYYGYYGEADSIEKYVSEGLALSRATGYTDGEYQGNYKRGWAAYLKSDYSQSIDYFEKALELAKRMNNERYQCNSLNALGSVYWSVNDFNTAQNYFLESASLAEMEEIYETLPAIYGNIGLIADTRKDWSMAKSYYKKSLQLSKKYEEDFPDLAINQVNVLVNLTACLALINELDSAYYYTQMGIQKSQEINYEQGLLRLKQRLSTIEINRKNYSQSIQYAQDLIQEYEPEIFTNYTIMIALYRNIAKSSFHLNKMSEAMEAVEKGFDVAEKCGSLSCQKNALDAAIYVYKGLGQFQQAFSYQEELIRLNDSIMTTEKDNQLQALQSLYENEKKERALAVLNMENETKSLQLRQQKFFLLAIFILAILGLVAIFLSSRQRILKEQKAAFEAEQRLLRFQMNPHFLFNALSAIQSFLFDKADAQIAIQYLSKFAGLMRQVLEYSREPFISLEEEIQTLDNYLALQQLRHNHAFDYEIEVSPDIQKWETLIPPIMAQPFVENAIEHGRIHLMEDGKIKVHFKKEADQLLVTVEDNGIGRSKSQTQAKTKQHRSLATTITKERIQLLKKLKKKPFSFSIKDLPERGTRVIFQYPIMQS